MSFFYLAAPQSFDWRSWIRYTVRPGRRSSTLLWGFQKHNSDSSSSYILWHTCVGVGHGDVLEGVKGTRAEEETPSVSVGSAAHTWWGGSDKTQIETHTHTHNIYNTYIKKTINKLYLLNKYKHIVFIILGPTFDLVFKIDWATFSQLT